MRTTWPEYATSSPGDSPVSFANSAPSNSATRPGRPRRAGDRVLLRDLDAIAVQAHNDWVAGVTEVRTIMLLMLTEDVPECIIQLVFLFRVTLLLAQSALPACPTCSGLARPNILMFSDFSTSVQQNQATTGEPSAACQPVSANLFPRTKS